VTADEWEARYGARGPVWSGRVNPWLAEVAAGLPPGRALDLACGEGADAIHLAQHGWQVTAVDFAANALARGAAAAAEAGVGQRITWEQADLTSGALWAPPYDLVALSFFHPTTSAERDAALRSAWEACGGTLLVVAHDPSSAPLGPPVDRLYGVAEIVAAIGTEPAVAQVRPRSTAAGLWVDAVVVAARG
jgi:SAM-dependent methyltransferase